MSNFIIFKDDCKKTNNFDIFVDNKNDIDNTIFYYNIINFNLMCYNNSVNYKLLNNKKKIIYENNIVLKYMWLFDKNTVKDNNIVKDKNIYEFVVYIKCDHYIEHIYVNYLVLQSLKE